MYELCGQILDFLDNNESDADGETNANGVLRIFSAWVETLETKKIWPNGDAIFEARFVRKSVSLKWLDSEN